MATIGVDLTPIQGPHRMRGVGSVVINVLKHIAKKEKAEHTFVFYVYQEAKDDALELINAASFPNHEVRLVPAARPLPPSIKSRQGLLDLPRRIKDMRLDRRLGTKRIVDVADIDTFLQFEQDVIPPSSHTMHTIIVAYDLIPYVLEADYLWNYTTARKGHHYSRRGALLAHLRRQSYLNTIRTAMNAAHKVIAISEHTKQDFVKYVGLSASKIDVCHLGVSDGRIVEHAKPGSIERYVGTSWGDVKIKTTLPDTPFLLFVGGADARRKLADLMHAFNLLRAQGHAVHLVLAGDTMLGPNSVPNGEARKALLASSYLDDIYLLGFVDDATREWLYQNALAFVYPSVYEGFGLPILEAMRYGTPVITYRNSSIEEISADIVSYAEDHIGIQQASIELLRTKPTTDTARRRIDHANRFTWKKCADMVCRILSEAAQPSA